MKKTTMAIAVIVIAITIGLYLYGNDIENRLHMNKPALKLTIATGLNETEGTEEITNVTFEQTTVPIYYRSADSPVQFPDIDVEAKNNTPVSAPVSYWLSSKRTSPNSTYTFMLTFREPYKPVTGELLILTLRMNDFRGFLEYKTTAFYAWQ